MQSFSLEEDLFCRLPDYTILFPTLPQPPPVVVEHLLDHCGEGGEIDLDLI